MGPDCKFYLIHFTVKFTERRCSISPENQGIVQKGSSTKVKNTF